MFHNNRKILIIGPIPPPYHGVSVVTEAILQSKIRSSFTLLHLDTSDRRKLSNLGKIDFRNIYLSLQHFLKLLFLLSKSNPEVVYIPISQTVLGYLRDCLFLLPARVLRKKIIIHLHGGHFREFYTCSNKYMKTLIRWTLRDIRKAIILGENLRYIFGDIIPAERIAVVSNGIGDPYPNTFYNRPHTGNKSYKILYLSSLAEVKGYIDLIHAMPAVLRFNKSVKFIFAGEFWGTKIERITVSKFIHRNNLKKNINFSGVVIGAQKRKLLLSSDIFVFPSHNEGQPIALIEAMAAGLPIISTDTGAIKEMVIDGENGFIVEKQNPNQISEKIILLLKNKRLRKKMGNNCRKRFLKSYTKDRFIANLSRVFDEVVSE